MGFRLEELSGRKIHSVPLPQCATAFLHIVSSEIEHHHPIARSQYRKQQFLQKDESFIRTRGFHHDLETDLRVGLFAVLDAHYRASFLLIQPVVVPAVPFTGNRYTS